MRKSRAKFAALATVLLSAAVHASELADLVVIHARVYTEDPKHSIASALAVKDGRIVFVGSETTVEQMIGPTTKVLDATGRLILPGLIDSHVHPTLGLYKLDICDLQDDAKSLAEITEYVKGCLARFPVKPGEWLTVSEWNYAAGNQTDLAHPTIREALDLASNTVPIQLLGSDFHHGGFNSAALALARRGTGAPVGYTSRTLRHEFSSMARFVGVDAQGEPDGTVNENARAIMGAPGVDAVTLDTLLKDPVKTMEVINGAGITALRDAWVRPGFNNRLYDALEERGQLTARVNLTLFYPPREFIKSGNGIDRSVVDRAKAVRDSYAHNPLIKADAVKIVADGVLEGNPRAQPPTLPTAAVIKPFLQPQFAVAADGSVTVTGYVDTQSQECATVRAQPALYASTANITAFRQAHGFLPAQCALASGRLLLPRRTMLEYARAMHLAGFTLHIHAIGDETVRTAIDAIEYARAADANSSHPDAIAHLQLVSPRDVQRIGRDHLFAVYTLGWAAVWKEYDLTVIPFIDKVADASYAGLHDPNGYYERQAYPTLSTLRAGAIIAAGSDAPVGERNPRPFANIAVGVTRRRPGDAVLGAPERLDIQQAIDAYTINGARELDRQEEIGSLEPGKSADFIVLDQDILSLAESGEADRIADTQVLETYFRGQGVYRRQP